MEIDRKNISHLIGKRIQKFRTQRKLSQEDLALASEMHPAYLGRVERGERCPTIDTLYRISRGLKVPLHELLNISSDIRPSNNEAIERIKNAMSDLTDSEAVEIAEIIERIISLKKFF